MSKNSSNATRIWPLRIRAPQDFAAGICLVVICVTVLWAVGDLKLGTVQAMGPAMFPRVLAVLLGLGGVVLIIQSVLRNGEPIGRLSLRGPVIVVVGIIAFALTIRTLGLAVAGVLAIVVSGFASAEARLREVIVFAVAIAIFCIVLFRYLLGMAVPILIIPGTSIGF